MNEDFEALMANGAVPFYFETAEFDVDNDYIDCEVIEADSMDQSINEQIDEYMNLKLYCEYEE